MESLLSKVFLQSNQYDENRTKQPATRFQDPSVDYKLTYRLFRAMAQINTWHVPFFNMGQQKTVDQKDNVFERYGTGDPKHNKMVLDTMVALHSDEPAIGEYGLAVHDALDSGNLKGGNGNASISVLVFTSEKAFEDGMKKVVVPIWYMNHDRERVQGISNLKLGDLSLLTKLPSVETSDSLSDGDAKPRQSGKCVKEIIVNFGTQNAFHIPSHYFDALSHWHGIIEVEQALHHLRSPFESVNEVMEGEGTISNEKIADIFSAKQDARLTRNSFSQIEGFGKYFVFMKVIEEKKQKQQLFFVPREDNKRYVALFTAPDMAYRFAEKHNLDQSMMRTIAGNALFRRLHKRYITNPGAVDGVIFNASNTDPEAPNRELTMPTRLLPLLISSVPEMEKETDNDAEE